MTPTRPSAALSSSAAAGRGRLAHALRVLWILACLVAVALVIILEGRETAAVLSRLAPSAVAASLAAALAAVALSAGLWNAALRQLGGRLGPRGIVRLFFPSQIGKYLPGGVWPVLAHATQASQHGLTPTVGATAFAWFLWLHLTTGGGLGVLFLAAGGLLPAGLAAASLPMLALSDVRVAAWANAAVVRLTRGRVRLPVANASGTERVQWLLWSVVMWGGYGLHLAALTAGLGQPITMTVAIGAFAASWTIGFLTLVAPAGAGVREVALVAILGPVTGVPAAVAAAAVSRVLLVVADAAWAVVGVAMGLRDRRVEQRGRPDRAGSYAHPEVPRGETREVAARPWR